MWTRRANLARVVFTLAGILFLTQAASAQDAGIGGVVSDDTGGVLPGVTVTAASPVLIEGQRIAISDGEGRYAIPGLLPGAYDVTFSLPGFNQILREGIELTAGFTANVNAELGVGGIEETITVTGATPVVDIQNVRRQSSIDAEALAQLLPRAEPIIRLAAGDDLTRLTLCEVLRCSPDLDFLSRLLARTGPPWPAPNHRRHDVGLWHHIIHRQVSFWLAGCAVTSGFAIGDAASDASLHLF